MIMDNQFETLKDECLAFTDQFLTRPDDLSVDVDDYASGRFEHENVPCFTSANGKMVMFNSDWLKRSLPDHADDVRFFIFHELRHVHQKYQIAKQQSGEATEECAETISVWDEEFRNYQTNYGDADSQNRNFAQEIEQDANAYALALINMKYLGIDDGNFEFSLPEEAFELADTRSQEYYRTKPELKRYYDKRYRELTGKRICEKKPERNELCPCGSGKKFKQCCIGKNIYD